MARGASGLGTGGVGLDPEACVFLHTSRVPDAPSAANLGPMPGVGRISRLRDAKSAQPLADIQLAELAKRQHGVVSIRQLLALGITHDAVRARVDAGRLHRIHVGVYAVGHANLSMRGRWMAAVLAYGRGALLSHHDAAALEGLRGTHAGRIHVTMDTRAGLTRREGLIPHRSRLHPEDRERVDGIPVTSVPRTLLDLAEVLGVGALRALLDYDPAPAAETRSELERLFLDLVRDAGLPTPSVNVLVEDYLVDAYWPAARLVVELDSYEYHRGRAAFERDHAELGRLRLAGYEVLPLTYLQVTEQPDWVARAVRSLLERGAAGRNG